MDGGMRVLPLQGPPGTGKSEVVVALVKLLTSIRENIRILVTAPSNAAVDAVGRRIINAMEVSGGCRMVVVQTVPRKIQSTILSSKGFAWRCCCKVWQTNGLWYLGLRLHLHAKDNVEAGSCLKLRASFFP